MIVANKYPNEQKYVIFDFSLSPEVAGGDAIASIVSVTSGLTGTASDLTFANQEIVAVGSLEDAGVLVRVGGGTDGVKYPIYCTVVTAGGSTLTDPGFVFVTLYP